jgi:F-type H+-transporting ATPase subunit c
MKLLPSLVLVVVGGLVLTAPLVAQDKKYPAPTTPAEFAELQAAARSAKVDKFAPPTTPVFAGAGLAAGLGMGLTIIGAGLGLGRIGSAALESMARQPEVAPRVQTAMIIIAAMLEGATLASVILCYLLGGNSTF